MVKLISICDKLKDIVSEDKIYLDEPMFKHTTFKIGGPADALVIPKNPIEIVKIKEFCNENNINSMVIGRGSNLLVKDKGYRGIIIKISDNFKHIENISDEEFCFGAGISLRELSNFALSNALTGVEFASGIPGNLGGAVFMNAGAYDGEMKDIVTTVNIIDNSTIKTIDSTEVDFSYRNSSIQKNSQIVLSVNIKLKKGNSKDIKEKIEKFEALRKEKQPIDLASAGSTFKRPENNFAGKLIMDSGLKGFSVGDAQVSEKHCGFVVNKGKATADDVLRLIEQVKEEVYKNFKITLEPEIRIIGE